MFVRPTRGPPIDRRDSRVAARILGSLGRRPSGFGRLGWRRSAIGRDLFCGGSRGKVSRCGVSFERSS
jgi:hypothetical protein